MSRLIIIGCVVFALAGCSFSKTMDASHTSKVDPDFVFNTDKVIGVYVKDSANPLDSKFYVSKVVEALKQKGFANAYSYKQIEQQNRQLDLKIFINVDQSTASAEQERTRYDDVPTGNIITECTEKVVNNEKKVTCVERREQRREAVGTYYETVYFDRYTFSTDWVDAKNGETVMTSVAKSTESGCTARGVFDFLVEQSIQRIQFDRPINYDYSVTMPEQYSCRY